MASPLTQVPVSKVDRTRGPGAADILLKFGGGLNTSASEEDIADREAAAGENFLLDQSNYELRNRKPFDSAGTAPNGQDIRGIVNLIQTDGTVRLAVQAGDTVYEHNGFTFGSSIATVDSSARLRGSLDSQWPLDDKVLISDLNLVQPVMEWDGNTFKVVDDNLPGEFKARYCFVSKERAFYGNVESNAIQTPNLIAASAVEDYANLDTSNKPSSSLGDADPFYLLTPDLKAINGLVSAFNKVVVSSQLGSMHQLLGDNSQNFNFEELYPFSGATGEEAVTYVGNDIVYGRQGRIQSIEATQKFGDVQANDITVPIFESVKDVRDWLIVYNGRLQRIYCFDGSGNVFVYNKNLALGGLRVSPWSRWTTFQSSNFIPSAIQRCLSPSDGREYVFFGNGNGLFYRMEGEGEGDAGSNNIKTEFLSKLFTTGNDAEAFNLTGWLGYRSGDAQTVTLSFEWAGKAVFNETITITLPPVGYEAVYGGATYYGGASYYGAPFAGRLTRSEFGIPGRSDKTQVRVTVEGSKDFQINEIGLKFEAAKTTP